MELGRRDVPMTSVHSHEAANELRSSQVSNLEMPRPRINGGYALPSRGCTQWGCEEKSELSYTNERLARPDLSNTTLVVRISPDMDYDDDE